MIWRPRGAAGKGECMDIAVEELAGGITKVVLRGRFDTTGAAVIAMPGLNASRLVLHSEVAELDRLAGWIEGWTQRSALPPYVSFAMALCLEEAVANVIMYGGTGDDRLEITVEVEHNAGTSVVRIEDNGRQFDPTQVPSPPVAASLEEAKIGSVGVHLMRSFASGMHYERRNGRNRLTLRFRESEATSKPSGSRQ